MLNSFLFFKLGKLEEKFIDKRAFINLSDEIKDLRILKSIKEKEEELRVDFNSLSENFSTFMNHTKEKMSNMQKELDESIQRCKESKVNVTDFKTALDSKANKHSVATALHRKANK